MADVFYFVVKNYEIEGQNKNRRQLESRWLDISALKLSAILAIMVLMYYFIQNVTQDFLFCFAALLMIR